MHYRTTRLAMMRVVLPVLTVLTALWQAGFCQAQSYTLKTLYTFNGTDNAFPSGMTLDNQGNIYGVALRGGPPDRSNNGIVYKFTPTGLFTTLAVFDGLDGDAPVGSPLIDAAGNLWGTTTQGGVDWHPEINHYGLGTLYKISSTGVFTPGIVEFTGPHGMTPVGAVTMDSQGNLLGATYQGGFHWDPSLGNLGTGTIFQMMPAGVVSSLAPLDGGNGAFPNSEVAIDSRGNIFGTTQDGGTHGFGTLYKISSSGVMTTLTNFNGVNGKHPMGSIAIDAQGNLYGTTYEGGVTAINNAINGYGTIWKYSPTGGLTTLASFNGANGMFPEHGVTVDLQGNLFGCTVYGGSNGKGVVWEYSTAGVLSTLVSFDGANNGSTPYSRLSLDGAGNIYGVTNMGGAAGYGTLFVIQPVSTALTVSSVALSPASVAGGATAQGTVTISGPAPSGGMVVTLGSDNSYATPQGPVTIPAGATSAAFTISTQPVPDNTPVAISARLGASARQATLMVSPPAATAVAMVYLDENGVPGGTATHGTVLLNRVAPAGGMLATLSSASTNVTVPASVLVPAGAMTVDFPIATRPVTSTDDAMLTVHVGSSSMQAGLLVLPPDVSTYSLGGVSVNFATVQGTTPLVGRVGISRPAGVGGVTVTLTSNNPAVVVPSSITVPQGVAVASFPIQTKAVASNTVITITATLGSASLQTSATILPATAPTVSSLSLRPTSVQGGLSSQGMVTLNTVAPAGGAVVSLSSTSGAVGMPATIGIPEGETIGFFAITTREVSATTTAPITAAIGSSSKQVPLTLTSGSPGISVSSISLPTTAQGGVRVAGSLTLSAGAPFDGAIVTLKSTNAAVASVPLNVVVSAGHTSALFSVDTQAVTANTPVTISAAYGASTQTTLLTLTPAPGTGLTSLSFSPASVVSGKTSVGTVTLSNPAPTGGLSVSLFSSDTSVASVPASVTVAAGTTSATFTLTSVPVAATSTATINATAGVVSQQATITVAPSAVSLASLTLSPSSVVGGNTSQATVTLSNPAPSGGALVTLSSSNTGAATVPASVTVPAGSVSSTFTVTTRTVAAQTTATLSAAYGGSPRTAILTVRSAMAADTVAIQWAEYIVSKRQLQLQATSTSASATLKAYVTSTDALIGTLTNKGGGKYEGQFAWPANPQNVTIRSSLNGSASKAVTLK